MTVENANPPRFTSSTHLCRHCGNKGIFYILVEHTSQQDTQEGDTAWETWMLVRCPPCEAISLMRARGSDLLVQSILDDGDNPEVRLIEYVYPPGTVHPRGLPKRVAEGLEAAERVRSVNFNGYAVLLGRVIETVCDDRDAKGSTLYAKLEDLQQKGEISPKLGELATGFRKLRNIGAHADRGDLSAAEADLLYDLCRALLESIYTLPYLAALAEGQAATIRQSREGKVDAKDVIKIVASHFGLEAEDLKTRSNSRQVAFPRQVAMYVCKRVTDLSYPAIGKLFGNKHHSTVMYAVEKLEELRRTDPELDRTITSIIDECS